MYYLPFRNYDLIFFFTSSIQEEYTTLYRWHGSNFMFPDKLLLRESVNEFPRTRFPSRNSVKFPRKVKIPQLAEFFIKIQLNVLALILKFWIKCFEHYIKALVLLTIANQWIINLETRSVHFKLSLSPKFTETYRAF